MKKKKRSKLTDEQAADCVALKTIFDAVNAALVAHGAPPLKKKDLARLSNGRVSPNLWSMHVRGTRALTLHVMGWAAAIYGFPPHEIFRNWPWTLHSTDRSVEDRALVAHVGRLCKAVVKRAETHRRKARSRKAA